MRTSLRWSVPVIAATALLASTAASALSDTPAGPGQTASGSTPVPASFQPASASFTSPASGVVLGGVGCTAGSPCRAKLAATTTAGASWKFLPAPAVWLANASPTVNQVVSASQRNIWLYDQLNSRSIWATHNGGAHWSKLTLPGDIQAVAASVSTVYAVVAISAGDALYRSPAGSNSWARVGDFVAASASLAVFGSAAWFGASPHLWATANGLVWNPYPFGCPSGLFLSGISASSRSDVAFLCAFAEGTFHTAKKVLQSVNGGKTEHLAGTAPTEGDVFGFAVPVRNSKVVAIAVVTPGPDYVYRSGNGGKTWKTVTIAGTTGGEPLDSLQFVTATVGWLVVGGAPLPGEQLLQTKDAGISWHAVKF